MHDCHPVSQNVMAIISSAWCQDCTENTLESCFRFVKYKMNVKRDEPVFVCDDTRRAFCVALYEYTHRIVHLSEADSAYIAAYTRPTDSNMQSV